MKPPKFNPNKCYSLGTNIPIPDICSKKQSELKKEIENSIEKLQIFIEKYIPFECRSKIWYAWDFDDWKNHIYIIFCYDPKFEENIIKKAKAFIYGKEQRLTNHIVESIRQICERWI